MAGPRRVVIAALSSTASLQATCQPTPMTTWRP